MVERKRRAKTPPDEPAPEEPAPADARAAKREVRRQRTRDTAKTVAQVANAIRHRDELLVSALDLLQETGFIDVPIRDRIWDIYQKGDAKTRLFIQELVARVFKVPYDRLDELVESGRVEDVSEETLRRLESLSLPQVDVAGVADRVRSFDVDRLAARGSSNKFVRFLRDLPVRLHRTRIALILVGVLLVLLAGVALIFPRYAQDIAFYGFLALLAILGALLVRWGLQIGRIAKAYDIDLAVYARLEPEERQILLMRRVYLQLVDTERLGDLVERGLGAFVPETLQRGPEAEPPPPPSRPLPKRPTPTAKRPADAAPDGPDRARGTRER